MRPADLIDTAMLGHREVVSAVKRLDRSDSLEPSLLPGWSRAHVIAHLAHKSRSHVNVFEGARVEEVRSQYPGGIVAAETETEAWSRRPVPDLISLLADSFSALERAWERLPDNGWQRRGISSAGERSMLEFVERHMRDVFVHHVDLDVGYRPANWPTTFISSELPKRSRDLPDRAEPSALLAWLLGRAPAPELSPW